jgi:hypothetical protein
MVWLWMRIDERLPWPPTSIIAVGLKDLTPAVAPARTQTIIPANVHQPVSEQA